MTIQPQQPGAQPPALPSDYDGLDEFGVEDMVTPRLSIVHRDGLFKDSLTNQTYQSLNLIVLGLVKQRILWPDRMDQGDMPMCRSNDHKTGFVNLTLGNKPPQKQFPWAQSNFDPNQQMLNPDGRLTLPCDSCELKEWGTHPDGKRPFCAELFTLPVMYDPMSSGEFVPALVSFQKTQLKPLRSYLSSFQRMGTPPFQVYTQVTLTVNQYGQNPFSVPNFTMGEGTDPNRWVEYAQNYRSMAQFLREDPRQEEDKSQQAPPPPSNNQWGQGQANQNPWEQQGAPVVQQPWPAAQQVIQGQVVQPQQPAVAQQPVQQAPQQPVQQAPQQPVQQAPQQPVQQAPQQPVQQAPQQPVQQAPQQPVQQAAPPPFEQQAPAPTPDPAPAAPAPEAAAAPATPAPGIVGGWAAQVEATPQEAPPESPAPTPDPEPEPQVEQPPAQPVQQQAPEPGHVPPPQGAGTGLPF